MRCPCAPRNPHSPAMFGVLKVQRNATNGDAHQPEMHWTNLTLWLTSRQPPATSRQPKMLQLLHTVDVHQQQQERWQALLLLTGKILQKKIWQKQNYCVWQHFNDACNAASTAATTKYNTHTHSHTRAHGEWSAPKRLHLTYLLVRPVICKQSHSTPLTTWCQGWNS